MRHGELLCVGVLIRAAGNCGGRSTEVDETRPDANNPFTSHRFGIYQPLVLLQRASIRARSLEGARHALEFFNRSLVILEWYRPARVVAHGFLPKDPDTGLDG